MNDLITSTVTTPTATPITAGHAHISHPDTLVDLCRLWPLLRHHEGSNQPPSICSDPRFTQYLKKDALAPVLDMDALDYIKSQQKMYDYDRGKKKKKKEFYPVRHLNRGEKRFGHTGFIGSVQYSGRSISLVGILGGIIFILLMIACATCIKHRKRYPLEQRSQDRLARQMIVDHIRTVTQGHALLHRQDKPPDYDTVVKEEEEDWQLPSYLEAMGACSVECTDTGETELRQVIVEEDDRHCIEDDRHCGEDDRQIVCQLEQTSSETTV